MSPAVQADTGVFPSAMLTIVIRSSIVTWPVSLQSPPHGFAVAVGVGVVLAVAVTVGVRVAVAVGVGVADGVTVGVGAGV